MPTGTSGLMTSPNCVTRAFSFSFTIKMLLTKSINIKPPKTKIIEDVFFQSGVRYSLTELKSDLSQNNIFMKCVSP